MNFLELAKKRYSCRNYSDKAIDKQDIEYILEATQLAPSACNRQPWTFYVVSDPQQRATMLQKSKPAFVHAPILIVAVGHHEQAWHRPSDGKDHTDVDLSIAIEHLCLAAAERGLGTCWICSFDTQATAQSLNLPATDEPIALITLGHPADENIPAKTRKPLSEIVKYV